MTKLKRLSDGKVIDCAIVLSQDSNKVNIMTAVFYEYAEWKMQPLHKFIPAIEGVDY